MQQPTVDEQWRKWLACRDSYDRIPDNPEGVVVYKCKTCGEHVLQSKIVGI